MLESSALPTDCAVVARQLAEPLAGSAPQAIGWVVIEIDGAWAPQTSDNLAADVAAALYRHIGSLPIRVQLLRTPGAHPRSSGGRRVLLAHSGPTPWMVAFDDVAPDALADLPITATVQPSMPAAGTPVDGAALLVCTHGTRDRCCARFGRPVVSALLLAYPHVYETSHVGGHRFAGNVLQLPEGLVYGNVDDTDADRIATAASSGRVCVDRLRGRTSLPPVAQAAEIFVRQHRGLDGDVHDVDVTMTDPDTFVVRIGQHTTELTVEAVTRDVVAPMACGEVPTASTMYRCGAIEVLG